MPVRPPRLLDRRGLLVQRRGLLLDGRGLLLHRRRRADLLVVGVDRLRLLVGVDRRAGGGRRGWARGVAAAVGGRWLLLVGGDRLWLLVACAGRPWLVRWRPRAAV